MTLTIELDLEVDGRYIADVVELPGVTVYGATETAAVTAAKALAYRVLADKLALALRALADALERGGAIPARIQRQIQIVTKRLF